MLTISLGSGHYRKTQFSCNITQAKLNESYSGFRLNQMKTRNSAPKSNLRVQKGFFRIQEREEKSLGFGR